MTNPYLRTHDSTVSMPATPTSLARRVIRALALIAALACALLALLSVFLLVAGVLAMLDPQSLYLYMPPGAAGAFQGEMIAGPFVLAAFLGRLCWHLVRAGKPNIDKRERKPSLPRRIARSLLHTVRTLFAMLMGAMLLDAVLGAIAIAIASSKVPAPEHKLLVLDATRVFVVWLPLAAAVFCLGIALLAARLARHAK